MQGTNSSFWWLIFSCAIYCFIEGVLLNSFCFKPSARPGEHCTFCLFSFSCRGRWIEAHIGLFLAPMRDVGLGSAGAEESTGMWRLILTCPTAIYNIVAINWITGWIYHRVYPSLWGWWEDNTNRDKSQTSFRMCVFLGDALACLWFTKSLLCTQVNKSLYLLLYRPKWGYSSVLCCEVLLGGNRPRTSGLCTGSDDHGRFACILLRRVCTTPRILSVIFLQMTKLLWVCEWLLASFGNPCSVWLERIKVIMQATILCLLADASLGFVIVFQTQNVVPNL